MWVMFIYDLMDNLSCPHQLLWDADMIVISYQYGLLKEFWHDMTRSCHETLTYLVYKNVHLINEDSYLRHQQPITTQPDKDHFIKHE